MPHAGPSNHETDVFATQRQRMVNDQLRRRGIVDERVLHAMNTVPRHRFVPRELLRSAYNDCPLPLGCGQTISQPYIVALTTELVRPQRFERALDVGTGCGYQAAVLATLVKEVFSIEIISGLAQEAKDRLTQLGYNNVEVRLGDGYQGWVEHAPFDIIVVAAAPRHVPQPLVDQLSIGGRMVIPVGYQTQRLLLIERAQDGSLTETSIIPVAFVPMTGEAMHGHPCDEPNAQKG